MPQLSGAAISKIKYAVVIGVLAVEIISPLDVAAAAANLLENKNPTVVLNRQYIAPSPQSVVMLSEADLEKRQQEWKQEREQVKPAAATVYMTASAYNSLPNQTDGSPYSTAIGSMTRVGVVASNYFPIGTRLRLPDLFGDQEFRVEDRMNQRYSKTLDVWMEDYSEAKQFGRKYVKVEIVEYGKGRGVE